jgi:mannose-1-phosphate guanylyltransferase
MVPSNAYAVILAGGSGKRLWPVSRTHHPKQFQKLTGDKSLLQFMASALLQSVPRERLCVQTTPQFLSLVQEQLPDLPADNIFVEPVGKDTAGAHAFAAATLLARDPAAILGVFYSDHHLEDLAGFRTSVEHAYQAAVSDPSSLVLMGIKPLYPHTGLGYIKMSGAVQGEAAPTTV